jgi:hypothetical protein
VAAPAATPAPPRPAAITPVEGGKPAAATAPPPGGPAGSGLILPAPAAGPKPGSLAYPYMIGNQPRQRSLAEMANEQLNPGGKKDKFATGVEESVKPDCLAPNQAGGLLAAPVIAAMAVTNKCK